MTRTATLRWKSREVERNIVQSPTCIAPCLWLVMEPVGVLVGEPAEVLGWLVGDEHEHLDAYSGLGRDESNSEVVSKW